MDTDLILITIFIAAMVVAMAIIAYDAMQPKTYDFVAFGNVTLGDKPDFVKIVCFNGTYFISLGGSIKPLVPGAEYELGHGLGYVKILDVQSTTGFNNSVRGVLVKVEAGNTKLMINIMVAGLAIGFIVLGVAIGKLLYDSLKSMERIEETFKT